MREPQALGVVVHLGGEALRPQRDARGHRLLHVRVAGQRDAGVPRREFVQRVDDRLGTGAQRLDDVAQVQPQRHEHLVVARAAEVDAPAERAELRRQQALERGLAVLVLERDAPLAARVRRADLLERGAQPL